MPIDYSHQHLSSGVMKETSPHEPIDPSGGGATPTLAQVLVAGNLVGGARLEATSANPGFLSAPEMGLLEPLAGVGGSVYLSGGDGTAGNPAGDAYITSGGANGGGGSNSEVRAGSGLGDGSNGKVSIYSNATSGDAGQALTSDGTYGTWQGIQVAAGVPAGNPTGLPFAYDTTITTGGLYIWNGSSWVKVATIL